MRMPSTALFTSNMTISFPTCNLKSGVSEHPRPKRDPSMRRENNEIARSRLGHARVNGKNDASAAPAVPSAQCPMKLANGKRDVRTSNFHHGGCGCCFHRAPAASCCTAARRRHTRRPLKASGSSPMVDAMAIQCPTHALLHERVRWDGTTASATRSASLRPHSPVEPAAFKGADGSVPDSCPGTLLPSSRVLPRPGAAGRYLLARWSPRCRPARARCYCHPAEGGARPRWRRTSKGTTGYSARVLSASRRVQRLRLFGRQLADDRRGRRRSGGRTAPTATIRPSR